MSKLTNVLAVLSILVAAAAHAGPPPPPTTVPTTTSAEAAAEAEAAALAAAEAEAAALAKQKQEANADALASTDGNAFKASTRVFAGSIPGHAAATAAEGCHESRGSIGAFGAGSGGKVTINADCLAHVQCMEKARFYHELGRDNLALRQLAKCEGVEIASLEEGSALYTPPTFETPLETAPPIEPMRCDEHVSRVFEACQTKGAP